MWVTLHAFALILLPVVTIAAIARYPRRRWFPETSNAWGFLIIFLYFSASVILFTCLCDHSGPWLRQTFVPLACMVASLLFIGSPRVRVSMILLGVVTGFALQAHLTRLIHAPGWAYDQNGFLRQGVLTEAQVNQSWLARVGNDIETRGVSDRNSYPPGWMGDLRLADGSRVYVSYSFANRRSIRFWHTRITGLLRVERASLDVWFPGGTLKEAADKLEVRMRPNQVAPQRG